MACRCGKDTRPEIVDARWWNVCPERHMEEVRLYDTKYGDDIDAPEDTLCAVLESLDIPACFGCHPGKRHTRVLDNLYLPTDADNPEDAAARVVENKLLRACEYGETLARCARCEYFFKCKEMS